MTNIWKSMVAQNTQNKNQENKIMPDNGQNKKKYGGPKQPQ